MVSIVKSPATGYKYFKTVTATPDSNGGDVFDSTFERSIDSNRNSVLRITLRIFYRPISPSLLTAPVARGIALALKVPVPSGEAAGLYGDADNNYHLIKDWTGPEWNSFITEVKKQANLWDSKFWLIPSDSFALFDIVENSWTNKSGSLRTRPNVKCAFDFQVASSKTAAHMTVDVVNLLGPGFFRSHSLLYNNTDTTIQPNFKPDWNSVDVVTYQPVIAHEIGHALGLPHIGVSRHLKPCSLAVAMGQRFPSWGIPTLYTGDANADVCYGTQSKSVDIDNIMGAGSKFSQENAQPWLNRMPLHVAVDPFEYVKVLRDFSNWRVSLSEVPPMGIVNLS